MNDEPDPQLERLIDHELRQLPPVQAPGELIARVHAAIAARQALPWWQQPWMTWPLAMRAVSAVFLLASIGCSLYLAGRLVPGWSWSAPADPAELPWLAQIFTALLTGFMGLVDFIGQYALLVTAGVLLTMYLSCVGLGTLCFRLAYNKR